MTSWLQVEAQRIASIAKDEGAHIIVVGVGNDTDRFEIVNLASHPYNRNSFFINSFSQFDSISVRLVEHLCDSE